jgi:hypothetical protein
VFHLRHEVRPPAPEVVVDVKDGDAFLPGPLLEGGDPLGHRQGVTQELIPFGELQVVDYVDQQQGNVRLVRGVTVQVRIFFKHHVTL